MEKVLLEVIFIFPDLNGWIVRRIQPGQPFEILPQSTLAGIPLRTQIGQPRKLDENGQPDFDHFLLRPLDGHDLHQLKMGQVVELVADPFPSAG